MIDLIVDNRETKVLASIQDRDLDKYKDFINIQVKPLDIGDVEISSSLVKYILERKTVADLISSLHDGRYKEQKYRLLSSGHHITYIIEGDDILSSRHQKKDILSSIYLYSIYRDNIHIVFTKNINLLQHRIFSKNSSQTHRYAPSQPRIHQPSNLPRQHKMRLRLARMRDRKTFRVV